MIKIEINYLSIFIYRLMLRYLLLPWRSRSSYLSRPAASEVLSAYIRQSSYPPWTSYFIRYKSIRDDHFAQSHFNFAVDDHNYHILRTGCYPYIKYHCTKRPKADLRLENVFYRVLKVTNLGIPCLAYGIAAKFLLSGGKGHVERVRLANNSVVEIYFLIKEDTGALN